MLYLPPANETVTITTVYNDMEICVITILLKNIYIIISFIKP